MDLTSALPIFIVTLREGFEAALVVAIVLVCLRQAHQSQLNRWVYQGVSGGIVASVLVGCLLAGVLQGVSQPMNPYTPLLKALLTSLFGAIAIGMLSWMLVWMTTQAKSLKGAIQGEVTAALDQPGGGKAIAVVVFIAVLREGFETVLFLAAQEQLGNPWGLGAVVLGFVSAGLLAYGIFQGGIKLNIRQFFQILGIFLLVIIGGLGIGVLKNLEIAAQWAIQLHLIPPNICLFQNDACLLGPLVWNWNSWLPDTQFPGLLLKTLLGYRDHLYLLQAIAYGLLLGLIGGTYFRRLRPT